LEAGAEAPAGLLARKETALLASIREHYTPAPIRTSLIQFQKSGETKASSPHSSRTGCRRNAYPHGQIIDPVFRAASRKCL
jgi:hypothetical protein